MAKKIFLLGIIFLFKNILWAEDVSKEDFEKLQIVYAMYDEFKDEFKSVETIAADELKKIKTKITFVDVREKAEQAISMIPNAISKDEFEKNKDKYKDSLIVTYCTIGYRSGVYAEKISKEGFNVRNLKGSLLAWLLSGESIQKNGKETLTVHVYGKKWNILPTKYKAIW